MKIDKDGKKLIVHLPSNGWKRDYFLRKTLWVLYHGWLDDNTLYYDTTVFSESAAASACVSILNVAKELGVEVTGSACEMLERMKAQCKEYAKQAYEGKWRRVEEKNKTLAEQPCVPVMFQNGWKVRDGE